MPRCVMFDCFEKIDLMEVRRLDVCKVDRVMKCVC
jgi:hypothetical protein